jgi:hypothetical protein
MKSWKYLVYVATFVAIAACQPAPPSAAPATVEATGGLGRVARVPGELVKFSGDDTGISEPFRLDVVSTVDISWEYSGSGDFALWLVNDTEELTDPSLFRILIKQAEGASTETAQYRLEPGDYHLEVELADGPWTVLAKAGT